MGAAINAWTTALLKAWMKLLPAHRLLLCLGLILGGCLMTFYLQVLNEHMVRADQVRLGPRTAVNTPAATPSTRR
jgi:hypothetical protein